MITGDYDELTNLANRHVCADHMTPLVVAWYGEKKTWVIRCGENHYPDSITRQLSLTEAYKAGLDPPEPIKTYIKKGMRRRAMQPESKQELPDRALLPSIDLATGELLSLEMVKSLIRYAEKYHLDPYRGHVLLMYSKPYITIDGYLYHANQSQIPYTLSSHPMTEDEKRDHMIDLNDHAWLATVILTGTNNAFHGIGIVTSDEMTAKSERHPGQLRSPVVAAHPWQLTQKRAEWQALRRAFPIGESE